MIAKLAPEGRLSASFLRSARRALQRLVETEWLITAGNGGPGRIIPFILCGLMRDSNILCSKL